MGAEPDWHRWVRSVVSPDELSQLLMQPLQHGHESGSASRPMAVWLSRGTAVRLAVRVPLGDGATTLIAVDTKGFRSEEGRGARLPARTPTCEGALPPLTFGHQVDVPARCSAGQLGWLDSPGAGSL